MSADDQRAAEPDLSTQAWWAWLVGTREVGAHPADRFAARDAIAYVERLRAELAETRAAAKPALDLVEDLLTERARLRLVVRTEDAAKRDAMVATDVWKMRADRLATAGDALADSLGKMKPGRDQPTADAMDALDAWLSVRGDAPTEPPAVGLPVTLSSPGAAAAVCERAGLTRNGDEWFADGVRVERVARQGWVIVVFRHWPMYGRQPIAELHPGAPSSLLVAAIEAARGGSR